MRRVCKDCLDFDTPAVSRSGICRQCLQHRIDTANRQLTVLQEELSDMDSNQYYRAKFAVAIPDISV